MVTYEEIIKRKDRQIQTCIDIKGVLKDFKRGLLNMEETNSMLYLAILKARSDGYKDGWSKNKQVKKKR